jgi:hypothetical protein
MISSTDTLKLLFLSAFILGILGLQTMPIITLLTDQPWRGYYWPFVDYPMYCNAHQEGDHIIVGYTVIATTNSGEEISINYKNHRDLGVDYWVFSNLVRKLLGPNGYRNASVFTALHPRGNEMVKLDVYDSPVMVSRDGPVEVEADLLASIKIGSGIEEELE